VQYRLGGTGKIFRAWAAINDVDDAGRTGPESPLRFVVLGDGQRLWASPEVRQARTLFECKVNVADVNTLELQVHCPGFHNCARAVWLEPQVLR
jgi:hypothetical protein